MDNKTLMAAAIRVQSQLNKASKEYIASKTVMAALGIHTTEACWGATDNVTEAVAEIHRRISQVISPKTDGKKITVNKDVSLPKPLQVLRKKRKRTSTTVE